MILLKNVHKAISLKDKIFGLIGQTKITPTLFQTRFGIHTFFMKVPIDVIVLNKKNEVVKLKQNLKPWRLFFWNPQYNRVVEMAKGSIESEKITISNPIELECVN